MPLLQPGELQPSEYEIAYKTVEAMVAHMLTRDGFKEEWENMDEPTQQEFKEKWQETIINVRFY